MLHLVFADHIKPTLYPNKDTVAKEDGKATVAYLKAFIVADKLMAEYTANRILDHLYEYYQGYTVDFELIGMLSSAGLRESSIYNFLIDELAVELKSVLVDGDAFGADDWDNEDTSNIFEDVTRDDAAEVLKRLAFAGLHDENWEKCDLHIHKLTLKCSDKSQNDSVNVSQ